MKLITSKQRNVVFSWCSSPVTIDKSADWGPGNMQHFPNGAFLKHDGHGEVTHGVQPNADKTAPVGWVPNHTCISIPCAETCYDKAPIWADLDNIVYEGEIKLETLDGSITYKVDEPCLIVAQDDNGSPSTTDKWVIGLKELKANYDIED